MIGEQPGHAEAVVRPAIAPNGGADGDPEQGSHGEKQSAGGIEAKGEAEGRQVAGHRRAAHADDTRRKAGYRGKPLQGQGSRPPSPDEAGAEQRQRRGQARNKQDAGKIGHGSPFAIGRPISRKSKKGCGAKPSARAIVVNASAITSWLRFGGNSSEACPSDRAGARMR